MRKKKKLTQTKLLKKYEPRMREIIKIRDGNRCQIKGQHHTCGGSLVADHRPASRGHHATFLDPRNLTLVCQNANSMAGPWKNFIVADAIANVVKKREGLKAYNEIIANSRKTKKWTEAEIVAHIEKTAEDLRSGAQ